jgi:hypothetical protein
MINEKDVEKAKEIIKELSEKSDFQPLIEYVEKLEAEGKKDYEGMRDMQAKFIDADHERIRLKAKVERLGKAMKEIADMKYTDNNDILRAKNIAKKALGDK